jgi:hypothetical protein
MSKKKKSIEAKLVKFAHRRRFQDYVREKGREKMTLAYVYWAMWHRSGQGNVFELEEGLFLADLGIGKNALRPARATLTKDGWLSKAQQKINPLTGKWGTTAWTVNTEPVAHSEGVGTVAPLTGDRSAGDTVVLHSLDAIASTSTCTPSASTSSGLTDLSINQSVAQGSEKEPVLTLEAKDKTNPEQSPEDFSVEMPTGWVYGREEVLREMAACWQAFRRGTQPSDEEVRLFTEILAKCDDNSCFPSQPMEWAQAHILNPKLLGALRSVKGLHRAVCGEGVSSTNGLLAQYKDHCKNPKACGICLKKTQGIRCASQYGCKNWVELGWDGKPSKYCAQCAKLQGVHPKGTGFDVEEAE